MKQSLAVKYRPRTYEEVCSQKSVIKILESQTKNRTFGHCYLLCGSSGIGKTTLARIFAKQINQGKGEPIEIDGASNNGVENIRNIVAAAKERSIDSEYKVYIIDEAHMITTAGWNAFLKCIEEPPEYTIFIFCTTDPLKVPATIQNRVIRLNLTRISSAEICARLKYICQKENFTNYEESCDYLSRICGGGMRDAIVLLEKAASYSIDLSIRNVITALGTFSYGALFDITNAIIDGDEKTIIKIIDDLYEKGNDMKLFIENYLDFVLDLTKYCIFGNMDAVKIPKSFEVIEIEKDKLSNHCVKYVTGIENNVEYFNRLVNTVLEIKNIIKYDSAIKTTIEIMLINAARGK